MVHRVLARPAGRKGVAKSHKRIEKIRVWVEVVEKEDDMKSSNRRVRRALCLSASAATVAAVVAAGVASSVAAAPASLSSGTGHRGPGYPPPKGIYALFTNCPLKNPVMHEATQFAACTAGLAVTGSITIGTITTTVVAPVQVQFGFWSPPNAPNYATVEPPLAGLSAQLVTGPDLLPESLTTALGCPSSSATVAALCTKAQQRGGKYNTIYALTQSAGPITNFSLTTWTQPVKFKLINPLLGNYCSIGENGNPIVLNPQLTINSGEEITDPDPAAHPDTAVIVTDSTASDTTFSAPGVTGCGPGGVANIAVDEALDTSAGLPAASGNSFTLSGAFDIAACSASGDTSLPQPQDDAAILLSAFKESSSAARLVRHRITERQLRRLFRLK
jgi:hypothetical protein